MRKENKTAMEPPTCYSLALSEMFVVLMPPSLTTTRFPAVTRTNLPFLFLPIRVASLQGRSVALHQVAGLSPRNQSRLPAQRNTCRELRVWPSSCGPASQRLPATREKTFPNVPAAALHEVQSKSIYTDQALQDFLFFRACHGVSLRLRDVPVKLLEKSRYPSRQPETRGDGLLLMPPLPALQAWGVQS